MYIGNRFLNAGFYGLVLAIFMAPNLAWSQAPGINELSEEEQRQVAIAERFLTVLERTPRPGTALDRIYGHHVEFGTLDEFMQGLKERVEKTSDDGTGWLILGLFESHRGNEGDAVDALTHAERLLPENAMASYFLGQALLLVGEPEKAVEAFERSIDRNPPKTDILKVFQQLGRIHQRAQRQEEALKVWERLEALFPNDPRVQEQIAVTLVDEGEFALALPRYEKLAEIVTDDYRRTMFRIEAAELKVREGQKEAGLKDLEGLLTDLNPESWLHRDVRRRIEDVFLRSGDQDALVKYYETWISTHEDDVDAMARLSKFLADAARMPEAADWLEKALKLAPSRVALRKSFIDQLVGNQDYEAAGEQFKLLVESAPGNVDYLRDWGRVILKNKELPKEERKAKAIQIWNQIIAARPEDALTHSQVADLLRQANFNDEALALYEKSVELSPNDPQYREYLGEFYHVLKRSDDALATWKSIAEGERRNSTNVARLAEVYNSFGYLEEAVAQIADASQLDPKDFILQIKAAEYHSRAGKYDESLAYVAAAEKLAVNDEEIDAVIKQRIDVFQSSRRLDDEIELLASEVGGKPDATVEEWHLLARYYEAGRQWANSLDATDKALELDPKSIPALTTAARVSELSGDYERAANMNRHLAEVDRRSRGDHLMSVARLEAQLGRTKEALQAGQDLIVSAPGNTDHYEFYAQLCFQLGESEQGLDTLRKAVRINPNEPALIVSLGTALSNQFRSDEAIAVYWRAFEKSEELDDKISLVMKLTDLHLQVSQFDKLIDRLSRDQREEDKRREMTICLAQAHNSAGDYGTARNELESLLSQDTRDTNLIQQLSKLCEEGSDTQAAIDYQRQLVDIAPGHETEYRLATLLQANGSHDEAGEIFLKLTRREEDPVRLLRNIDSLLRQQSFEAVIAITEPLLSEQRDDWELLYREAVAWESLEKYQEAQDRFERILAINQSHEELGLAAKEKLKRAQSKARSNNLRGIQSAIPKRRSPLSMLNQVSSVQRATELSSQNYYGGSQSTTVWTPDAFGVARMAAYGWLLKLEQELELQSSTDADPEATSETEQRFQKLQAEAEVEDAAPEALYDWLYLERLRGNHSTTFDVAKRMLNNGGDEEKNFFLNSLRTRHIHSKSANIAQSSNQPVKRPPLSEEDLELVLKCYEELSANDDKKDSMSAAMGQVAHGANGTVYVMVNGSWVSIGTSFSGGGIHFSTILEELRLAGRDDEAKAMVDEKLASAESAQDLTAAMSLAMNDERHEELMSYYQKWIPAAEKLLAEQVAEQQANKSQRGGTPNALAMVSGFLNQWMGGHLAPEEEHDQIMEILDPALDLAIEQVKVTQQLMAQRAPRRTSTNIQTIRNSNIQVVYGKQNQQYISFQMIAPVGYVDNTAINLLRQTYETFKRNDAMEVLEEYLTQRLEESSEVNRPYEQMMFANFLWWIEDQDQAMELLTAAADDLKDNPDFVLLLASMHESMRNYEDALNLMESLTPRDQKLVKLRETMVLQLAERVGDFDRAKQAAERLFGLRLSTDEQLALVGRMKRLGMHEMAEAVVARAQRRKGNQASSLGSLMTLYQGQGKTELATQIANRILRQTKPPAIQTSRYNQQSNNNGAIRTQALRVLQQTGSIDSLIERLEKQIEASPRSPQLYLQLMEFYEVANQKEKVNALLAKAIENRPEALEFQFKLGKHYEETGKLSEACDCFLVVLKKKPRWLVDDFYRYRNLFNRAKRQEDLAKTLMTMNLKSLGQPYNIMNLVSNMINSHSQQSDADPEDLDLLIDLAERCFEAFPSYRNNMLRDLYRNEIWKNDRIFELGKQTITPSQQEVEQNPWYGVDQISSYSQGGTANVMLHRMMSGIKGTDHMQELEDAVREVVKASPNWHGGVAVLALIEMETDRKDDAKERLSQLVSDEEIMKQMPSNAGWIVGQELQKFSDTRDFARQLLEHAVAHNLRQNEVQYTPVAKLVDVYKDLGEKEKARELLLNQLKKGPVNQYDRSYSAYQSTQSSIWAAKKFSELDFHSDAIRLTQKMISDKNGDLALASSWNSQNYSQEANKIFKDSVSKIDPSNAGEAVEQLLSVPDEEDRKDTEPVLDLMLKVPNIQTVRKDRLECGLLGILDSVSESKAISAKIGERLKQLQEEFPSDLNVLIMAGLYELQQDAPEVADTLESLSAVLADQPLEPIAENRRPNTRQRREALKLVPLWLLARECLQKPEHEDVGNALATQALKGAERQTEDRFTISILYEWGKLSLKSGDKQTAEDKFRQLLDYATRRPSKKTPKATAFPQRFPLKTYPVFFQDEAETDTHEDAARKRERLVAPLTMSQFRIAIEVATIAAENGMADLSRTALMESMAGGVPVPDAVESNSSRMMVIQSPNQGVTHLETQVATSLENVIRLWTGDEYVPEEVYALLTPIVFPENRTTEILLYADSSQLMSETIHSLGAVLAKWTVQAKKQAELKQRILERNQVPMSKVAGAVLLTNLALLEEDHATVKAQLEAVHEIIAKTPQDELIKLACHVALPAAKQTKLQDDAFPILRKTVELLTSAKSGNNSSSTLSIGKLAQRVNRILAKRGETESISDFFDQYLISRQSHYSNYGGDYGLYLQWQDTAKLAEEAGKIGMHNVALDYMGRVADFSYENYSRPSLKLSMTLVSRNLSTQPAVERYAAWKKWTLPTEDRKTLRLLSEWVPPVEVPEAFRKADPESAKPITTDLLCNFNLMVEAAKESGQLNELKTLAEESVEKKIPEAEFLLALTLIAADDVESFKTFFQPRIKTIVSRNKRQDGQPRPTVMGDYLVYRACMEKPEFNALYNQGRNALLQSLRNNYKLWGMTHVPVHAAKMLADKKGIELSAETLPEFKHWISVPATENKVDGMRPWWTSQEGHINHLTGTIDDLLMLKYPLKGDFEFSVDCSNGSWREGEAGYGGLLIESVRSGSYLYIKSYSDHETIRRRQALKRSDYNRVTIRHKDGELQHLLNNHVIYSEKTSGTSPFVSLSSRGPVTSSYRNFQFSGDLTIANEVNLFAGDRMDGWSTRFFGDSQPRHRLMAEDPSQGNNIEYYQRNEPTEHDWKVVKGVLNGKPKPSSNNNSQSWTYYARPLLDGETFRYQFFYTPNQTVAHPTIGRVALFLKPDGVSAHWIAKNQWDNFVADVPVDNEIVESGCQRGPGQLPLVVGDWNDVSLTIQNRMLQVTLNETLIYERPLEPQDSTRFGLFRWSQQGLRVRNAILSGPWPETVSEAMQAELIATHTELDTPSRRIINHLLLDEFYTVDASEVIARTQEMPDDEAYEFLKHWVLPIENHTDYRVYYERTPIDPHVDYGNIRDPLQTYLCPAWELMQVAKRLNKLEELRAEIAHLKPNDKRQIRARRAIATLAAITDEDDAAALGYLQTYLDEQPNLSETNAAIERTAPYIAALYSSQRPQLQLTALDLALEMQKNQQKKASSPFFSVDVDTLVGCIEAKRSELLKNPGEQLSQWTMVPYFKPNSRELGRQPSAWKFQRGVVEHIPGETWNQLFFQSPLEGNFEVSFERTLHGRREVSVAYGMHAAEPLYNYEKVRVNKVMHGSKNVGDKLDILPQRPSFTQFKVNVDGNKVSTAVADTVIHEETLAPKPDPWLMIQSANAGNDGWVRNLRITGNPTIPDQINLIDIAGWAAIRVDHYGEWFSTIDDGNRENVPWHKVGDEIIGEIRTDRSIDFRHSLLSYQRPMLEDGVFTFETFYVPEEYEIHPALGEVAFMIQSDGVKGHVLTNAWYETSDLTPNNTFDLDNSAEAVPLKENDWNTIQLTVKDNTVSFTVNDQVVATHELQTPKNRRHFGLFRYSNLNKCRVRNLIYKGDWPKELPSVEEQELAYPPAGIFADKTANWEKTIDLQFTSTDIKPGASGINMSGGEGTREFTPEGLVFKYRTPELKGIKPSPTLGVRELPQGDFQVTLEYSDLELGEVNSWGCGFRLSAEFEGESKHRIDIGVDKNNKGNSNLRMTRNRIAANGKPNYYSLSSGRFQASGRLRLLREGTVMHALFAELDSDQFEIVGTLVVGNLSLKKIFVQCPSGNEEAFVSAKLQSFTLQNAPE